MTVRILKTINDLMREAIPDTDCQDREILVVLAAARQEGRCIGMKQLGLLGNGTGTTARRRISRLVSLGYVVKMPNPNDKRSPVFYVTDPVLERLARIEKSLAALRTEPESRHSDAP